MEQGKGFRYLNDLLLLAGRDRRKAIERVEEEIKDLTVVRNYIWPSTWKSLPYILPKCAPNAEIINDLVMKSWETQGSSCREIFDPEFPDQVIMTNNCREITSCLMYYIKSLNVADGIKRVVGLKNVFGQCITHSFLKTEEGYIIDNIFNKAMYDHFTFEDVYKMKMKYLDVDPADPSFQVMEEEYINKSYIGRENQRLLYGADEKVGQFVAFVMVLKIQGAPFDLLHGGIHIYDFHMRKYIKEKYGVEIQNFVQKWSSLCWYCYSRGNESSLKKCMACKIATYCGKQCQEQDWKVHKIIHKEYKEELQDLELFVKGERITDFRKKY